MPTRQIVYALSNEASFFEDRWLKVGRTGRHAQARAAELSRTSVPFPFVLELAYEVADAAHAEDELHREFAEKRVTPNREFFLVEVSDLQAAMIRLGGRDVRDEVRNDPGLIDEDVDLTMPPHLAVDPETEPGAQRGPNAPYLEMGLHVGDEIICEHARETATVYDNRQIKYHGSVMSLKSATRAIYGRDNFDYFKRWRFRAQTLQDIYDDWLRAHRTN